MERANTYASQDYSKQTVYPLVDGNGTGNSHFVAVGAVNAQLHVLMASSKYIKGGNLIIAAQKD